MKRSIFKVYFKIVTKFEMSYIFDTILPETWTQNLCGKYNTKGAVNSIYSPLRLSKFYSLIISRYQSLNLKTKLLFTIIVLGLKSNRYEKQNPTKI